MLSTLQSFRDLWERCTVKATGATDTPNGTKEFVSYDGDGTNVLISDETHFSLYRYNSSNSPPVHNRVWTIHLPEEVEMPHGETNCCYKAITGTTVAVQKRDDVAPTFVYRRSDQHRIGSLEHVGRLRGALGDHFIYAIKRSIEDDDYIISLVLLGEEMILEPGPGRTWGHGISVCRASSYIIVVQCFTASIGMDVFSDTGKHIHYKKFELRNVPWGHSAITTCGPKQVMVARGNPPELHIYQLPFPERIRTISGADLGLGKGDTVKAVQYNEDDGIIHLTTGNQQIRNKLRTYKVEFNIRR